MTADREKVMFALFPELADRMPGYIEGLTFSDEAEAQMTAVQALLAEERAKARAPYEEAIDAVLAYCNEIDQADLLPGLADTNAIRTRLAAVDAA